MAPPIQSDLEVATLSLAGALLLLPRPLIGQWDSPLLLPPALKGQI